MSKNRKQHITPVLYLKLFSVDNRCFYYSKKAKMILKNHVNNIAEENNFYTLYGFENKYEWEEIYSTRIEPLFKQTLDSLLDVLEDNNKSIRDIDDRIICDFSECLYYQFLRSGYSIDYSNKIVLEKEVNDKSKIVHYILNTCPQLRTKLIENYPELINDDELNIDGAKDILKKIGKAAYKEVAVGNIKTDRLYSYFIKRKYVFYKIDFNEEFITCDDPVMLMNINLFDSTPFRYGLEDINTAIVFPISPKIVAFSYHEMNKQYRKENSIIHLCKNRNNEKFIYKINKCIFEHGKNFVISSNENLLSSTLKNL